MVLCWMTLFYRRFFKSQGSIRQCHFYFILSIPCSLGNPPFIISIYGMKSNPGATIWEVISTWLRSRGTISVTTSTWEGGSLSSLFTKYSSMVWPEVLKGSQMSQCMVTALLMSCATEAARKQMKCLESVNSNQLQHFVPGSCSLDAVATEFSPSCNSVTLTSSSSCPLFILPTPHSHGPQTHMSLHTGAASTNLRFHAAQLFPLAVIPCQREEPISRGSRSQTFQSQELHYFDATGTLLLLEAHYFPCLQRNWRPWRDQ